MLTTEPSAGELVTCDALVVVVTAVVSVAVVVAAVVTFEEGLIWGEDDSRESTVNLSCHSHPTKAVSNSMGVNLNEVEAS